MKKSKEVSLSILRIKKILNKLFDNLIFLLFIKEIIEFK